MQENTTSEWFVAKALMALAQRHTEAGQEASAASEPAPDAVVRDADPFAERLWNLLRIRRALTADDLAQGRRQAGALMLSWSRQCPRAVRVEARRVDGLKRYALLRDIGATPPAPRGGSAS